MSEALAITSNVRGALAKVADEVSRITHEEIVEAASRATAEIRSTMPRDTGAFADGFRSSDEPYGASIRSPVRYGGYVHEGRAERQAVEIAEREVSVALERAADRIGR